MAAQVDYIKERLALLEKIKESQPKVPDDGKPIKVTLPDGKVVDGVAHKTSPFDIANGIAKSLANQSVIAKVNDELWDMKRPLEGDCNLELLKFDSPEGKKVFWHSSAHILGQALEQFYGSLLCIGPPTDSGFYYDTAMTNDRVVQAEDYSKLKKQVIQIIKQRQPFERIILTKEQALELFKYNKYKTEIINKKVPDGETCTAYQCGPLVDLCKGPHVPHTGHVKAFSITKNSSAYWLGNNENDSLQRVYGVAFPDKKLLVEYEKFQAEAARRDHRTLGRKQELFFFHPYSAGCCFFLPHGAKIYVKLVNFIRDEYRRRGFTEVVTPNVFNIDLWKQSGHWQNYSENMFSFDVEKCTHAMKPMNCPGHCLMYGHRTRSYRELPIRFADFGVLHRNEYSGALTGLTRVRRFQQDDAHIFCKPEDIEAELENALKFMKHVYGVFGFEFTLELSTRPEKYLGDIEVWNSAEATLQKVLEASGANWKLNPGDGAFYGPKIDIHISDALKRSHQCATIQLDFQLPVRFELEYQKADGSIGRPVIIHRAIYGSVERFLAILIEHTAGKWPLWISPRQVMVVPVSAKFFDYAQKVRDAIFEAGYEVEAELSDKTMPKKIRESQMLQFNYILVVGEEEVSRETVNVRSRDQFGLKGEKARGAEMGLEEFINKLNAESKDWK